MHIYIHIPFCIAKCGYCGFASVAGRDVPEAAYIEALQLEIGRKADLIRGLGPIETIYLGGGTPSLFSAAGLGSILEALDRVQSFTDDVEISMESNPETITDQKAADLLSVGFNRISMGAQSFSDRLLKYMGRIHSAQRTIEAYDSLRAAGHDNINLDLIYGLPVESRAELEHDLATLARLAPEHCSAYMFQHEGSFTEVAPGPEGELAWQFLRVLEALPAAGLAQYEISNFARPDFECRHNLAYWEYKPYVGLGAAAVESVTAGLRCRNLADPGRYLQAPGEIESRDELSAEDIRFEKLFLALRTVRGIELAAMPVDVPRELYDVVGGRAVLNARGMLLSDEIFARLG